MITFRYFYQSFPDGFRDDQLLGVADLCLFDKQTKTLSVLQEDCPLPDTVLKRMGHVKIAYNYYDKQLHLVIHYNHYTLDIDIPKS